MPSNEFPFSHALQSFRNWLSAKKPAIDAASPSNISLPLDPNRTSTFIHLGSGPAAGKLPRGHTRVSLGQAGNFSISTATTSAIAPRIRPKCFLGTMDRRIRMGRSTTTKKRHTAYPHTGTMTPLIIQQPARMKANCARKIDFNLDPHLRLLEKGDNSL